MVVIFPHELIAEGFDPLRLRLLAHRSALHKSLMRRTDAPPFVRP